MNRARLAWHLCREHAFAFLAYALFAGVALFGVVLVWYAQRFPSNTNVPWPSVEILKEAAFKERANALADVAWMVVAVSKGYDRFPTDGSDPYAVQHNWAYFPLTIYVGKIINLITRDPFWSLQILSMASAASLLTLARALRKTWESARGAVAPSAALAHELLLVFFVMPISWWAINFTVLPMFLEYALFFTVLRIARQGATPSRSGVGLAIALATLTAFARPQGLVIDAFVGVAVLVHVRAPSMKVRATLVGGLFAPIAGLLLFYRMVVGNALAWYHVQRAWGRTSTMPWTPWIEEIKNGFFTGLYTSFTITGIRLAVVTIAIAWAMRSWTAELRTGTRSAPLFVEGWLLVASLVLGVLPFTTGTLLGSHRLMCFSMFPFFMRPEKNVGMHLPPLVILGFILLRSAEMAFLYYGALFALW